MSVASSDQPYRSRSLHLCWWIHPAVTVLLVASPALALAHFYSSADYRIWKTYKYLDAEMVLRMTFLLLTFITGILVTSIRVKLSPVPNSQQGSFGILRIYHHQAQQLDLIAHRFFLIVLIAYALWTLSAITNGLGLEQVLATAKLQPEAVSNLKRLSTPIAGVTTFTQFAPICVSIRALLLRFGYNNRKREIAVVILLSSLRAFLYGERLALIEVIVPIIVVLAVVESPERARSNQAFVRFAPVIALPSLWVLFAIFEYSRSWPYYRATGDLSYPDFVTQRLAGYYVTALNNSAIYSIATQFSPNTPYFSFPALWDAPVLSQLLGTPRTDGIPLNQWWSDSLKYFGNPEFNNKGTFLVVNADLGFILAFFYWLLMGLAIGFCFRRMHKGSVVALVAYSSSFVGLMEITRIIYWVEGRFVATAVGLLVLALSSNSYDSYRALASKSHARDYGTVLAGPKSNQGASR